MRLTYETATLSYCPDLTDGDAISVPIAVVVVGKSGRAWFAAAAGMDAKRLGIDPLSEAILSDLPHTIRRHVNAAMASTDVKGRTPRKVLRVFCECFRTSVHVSSLEHSVTIEVADAQKAARKVQDIALTALVKQVSAWTHVAAEKLRQRPPPSPPRVVWTPLITPERLSAVPEQIFWQPSPSIGGVQQAVAH